MYIRPCATRDAWQNHTRQPTNDEGMGGVGVGCDTHHTLYGYTGLYIWYVCDVYAMCMGWLTLRRGY